MSQLLTADLPTQETDRSAALLQVRDLKKHFSIRKGFLRKVVGHVKAVDGVRFTNQQGEV
jgi:ABC-type microcin C transport system duplicated ATPase subunit YejF